MAALKGGQRRTLPEDLENVEFETSEDVEVTPTFDGMGLREVGGLARGGLGVAKGFFTLVRKCVVGFSDGERGNKVRSGVILFGPVLSLDKLQCDRFVFEDSHIYVERHQISLPRIFSAVSMPTVSRSRRRSNKEPSNPSSKVQRRIIYKSILIPFLCLSICSLFSYCPSPLAL